MRNPAGNSPHILDGDLIQFADGEMPVKAVTATETHLRTCNKCRRRLEQLKSGANAYEQYHSGILKPSVALPQEWPSLRTRLDSLETPRTHFFRPGTRWWVAATLACCALLIGWFLYREAPARRMQQVLARAAVAQIRPHRRLQVTANGHSWYRPAALHGESTERSAATRALFTKANYSWDEPLSARSFADWRKQLPSKRDRVVSIRDSDGKNRFYRLQTETPNGVLRTAALILRADTLNPVQGAFHFEHQNDVTIDDAGEMPEMPMALKAKNPVVQRRAVVKEVGREEELRVFAALNAIGADVGEPVTVDIDPSKQQIRVVGIGLSANRERQIRQALAAVPNTALRFRAGQPAGAGKQSANGGSYPSGNSAPLRQTLETQAGGAQQFQQITDNALDASSTILARANALYVLSKKFPPGVAAAFTAPERETLRSLRRRHAIAIEQATRELKDALRPLLKSTMAGTDETQNQPATSWEVGAGQLYEQARLLDAGLGRILAGSYSQEAGQGIWNQVPEEMQKVEALARSQENVR